jgi:hypothetical protein
MIAATLDTVIGLGLAAVVAGSLLGVVWLIVSTMLGMDGDGDEMSQDADATGPSLDADPKQAAR